MKLFYYISILLGIFGTCFSAFGGGVFPGHLPAEADEKMILDTFRLDMKEVPPICIDASVVLTCEDKYLDKDVLEYTWTDKATGSVIGRTRSIRVAPKNTTAYVLKIKFILREKELIANKDFEKGYQNFRTDYIYESWNGSGSALWGEGKYKIAQWGDQYHSHFWNTRDHTSGKGNMMVVNGHSGRRIVVWEQTIKDIEPKTAYAFSAWGAALTDGHRRVNGVIVGWGQNLPIWQFSINDAEFGENFKVQYQQWNQFFSIWKSGSATTAKIALVDKVVATDGNDFALDDISFAPVKEGVGEIIVEVLPQVDLEKFSNKDLCEGESVIINANASGSGLLKYSWLKVNGLDSIEISRDASLSITNADMIRDNGRYVCRVSGTCGIRTEDFTLNIREKVRNSGMKVDTVDVCVGEQVKLSAGRSTGYKLKYVWRAPVDWTKPGNGWLPVTADGVNYTKYSASLADGGKYRCVVTGQCGLDTIFSVLRVEGKPKLLGVSNDTTVCVGQPVRLFVKSDSEGVQTSWIMPSGTKVYGDICNIPQVTESGIYKYVISGCNGDLSGFVRVDVFSRPSELSVSGDTAVCLGGHAVLWAAVSGTGVRYTWEKLPSNGGKSSFRQPIYTSTYTIPAVSALDTGIYRVTATDTCGVLREAFVHLRLLEEYGDLHITPAQTLCPGGNLTLEVLGGLPGFTYLWTPPKGSTRPGRTLVLSGVTADNAGFYTCHVTGVCSPGVDHKTHVTVNPLLEVSPGPQTADVCPGESVSFLVNTNGTVVWTKNGLPHTSGTILSLPAVSPSDSGLYHCRVHNSCGDTTLFYRLTLKTPVTVLSHSPATYVGETDPVVLYVEASGDNRTYQWKLDGRPVGDNSGHLRLPPFGLGSKGDHTVTCLITGDCGQAEITIPLYVRVFTYLTENTSVTLCQGQDYTYMLVPTLPACTVPGDTLYRLTFNGKDIGTGSVYAFGSLRPDQAGRYTWYVTGPCGDLAEYTLDVTLGQSPRLSGLLSDVSGLSFRDETLELCESVSVHLTASLTSPSGICTYQWYKDGLRLSGQNDSVLAFTSVKLPDAGLYTCRVTNHCGSDERSLTLVIRPRLRLLDSSSSLLQHCENDDVLFRVSVSGYDPVFSWETSGLKSWQVANSPFASSCHNPSVRSDLDNGLYSCHVSSSCGSLDLPFRLDIEKKLSLLETPSSDTLCRGNSVLLRVRTNLDSAVYTWTLPGNRTVNSSEFTLGNVSPSDTGVYRYLVSGRCSSASGQLRLDIYRDLGALHLSPDTSVCGHAQVQFYAFSDGDRVSYLWRGPHGFQSVANSLTFPDVTVRDTGLYQLTVKDICNLKHTGQLRLHLLNDLSNLRITRDTSVCGGSALSLEVSHDGEAQYEWYFHEALLGTSRQHLLASVSPSDTGIYLCIIKGHCRTEKRSVRVGLYRDLAISPMQSLFEVCPGENVMLNAPAVGEHVRYIWKKDGEEVGYRDSLFALDDMISRDGGRYLCEVTSLCGTDLLEYNIRVKGKTQILSHTSDKFVSENDSTRLVIRTVGEDNVVEWRQDGLLLGETGNSLLVSDVGKCDTLYFKVMVRGACGEDSATIEVKVGEFKPLRETHDPDTLCENSTYTYVADLVPVGCYGDENYTYTWSFRPEGETAFRLLHNPNGVLLRLENLTTANQGRYRCEVAGDCGTEVMEWTVYVMQLPDIKFITADTFIVEGSVHHIKTTVSGDHPVYSWTLNGHDLNTELMQLDFDPVRIEDQGIYRMVARNRCGYDFAQSEMKVWSKTTIISPAEQDISLCRGMDTILSVNALGAAGLVYHWYHNGLPLSVPLVNKLVLKNLQPEDAGMYKCIVNGRGGKDSCTFNLEVKLLPEISIVGKTEICVNDLVQEYQAESNEERVMYHWGADGGVWQGRSDLAAIEISWNGREKSRIVLEVTSLETSCLSRVEHEIDYLPLPDMSLILPEKVGVCLDSLVLDQGYPSGGDYRINGLPGEVVYFADKEAVYMIDYYYTDRCSSSVGTELAVAPPPHIKVVHDTLVTGWCRPVNLEVSEHSAGEISWRGSGQMDVADLLRPVYTPIANASEDLLFIVKLTDEYGCEASDEVLVSVYSSPRVDLGRDTTIGMCNDYILTCDYRTSWFDRVVWEPSANLTPQTATTALVIEKSVGANEFVAIVSDLSGCWSSDTLILTVVDGPVVNDREVCEGNVIEVDCRIYARYSWEDGSTDSVRRISEPGTYTLNMQDQYGCDGKGIFSIRRLPDIYLPDTLLFEGQGVEYKVVLDPAYEPYIIRWQDGSNGETFWADKGGEYRVQVADNIGCTSSDTSNLDMRPRAIAAPDAFLPGSTAENSRFYLKEVNFVSRFEMYIYNRWGELMYKTDEIGFNGGWNGKFKGMDCLPGVYLWVVFADGKELGKGTVTLVK